MESILIILLPFVIIGLLVMSIFQLIGGKYIGKLKNISFGSSFLINLFSFLITSIILYILGKMEVIESQTLILVIVIVLPIISLILITKIIWKCDNYMISLKCSLINILINIIFWIYVINKFSDLLL